MRRGVVLVLCVLAACTKNHERHHLTIFAAASLATTLDALRAPFAREHPGWDVRTEISGSRIACRKVIDEGRATDLVVVADHELIDTLLIPAYATFAMSFATNSLVLAHARGSMIAATLEAGAPWQTVLMGDGVRVGIGDPEQAPVGYRALMALALNDRIAEPPLRTGKEIAARIEPRNKRDDVAKLALALETGTVDAAFVYASDAEQRHLPYQRLDPAIDFSDTTRADWYANESYTIAGVTIHGSPAVYALTIPTNAEHPAEAADFARIVISSDGQALLRAAQIRPLAQPQVAGEPPSQLR